MEVPLETHVRPDTLTVDPQGRARRLLAAAEATRDSGALDAALALLQTVELLSLDDESRARTLRIRGLIAIEQHRRAEAVDLLLAAASRFGEARAPEARETALEALVGSIGDAELDDPLIARTAGAVADVACRPADPVTLTDLLLRGLYLRVTAGFAAAAPMLRRALHALVEAPADRRPPFGAFRLMALLPVEIWDEYAWGVLGTRQVAICRRDGALGALPAVLIFAASHRIFEGDFSAAEALLAEAVAVAAVTGGSSNCCTALVVQAWRGDETGLRRLRNQMSGAIEADCAEAVLANGLGRFDVALAAARRGFDADRLAVGPAVVSELMDAAAHAGAIGDLRAVRDWLATRTAATPGPWAFGVRERSEALLAGDDSAEYHYLESIRSLSLTRARLELARSHLLFGEWLRRRGRRDDARRHLREAHETFRALGADGFAHRSARELAANGDASGHPAWTAPETEVTAVPWLTPDTGRESLTAP